MNKIQIAVKQAQDATDSLNTAKETLESEGYNVGLSKPYANRYLLTIKRR